MAGNDGYQAKGAELVSVMADPEHESITEKQWRSIQAEFALVVEQKKIAPAATIAKVAGITVQSLQRWRRDVRYNEARKAVGLALYQSAMPAMVHLALEDALAGKDKQLRRALVLHWLELAGPRAAAGPQLAQQINIGFGPPKAPDLPPEVTVQTIDVEPEELVESPDIPEIPLEEDPSDIV